MYHHMLQIDDHIHDDDRGDTGKPEWCVVIVKQPPATHLGKSGDADSSRREEQADQKAVEKYQPEIVGPAHDFGNRQRTTRGKYFPQAHHGQHAEEKPHADGLLIVHDEFSNIHDLPQSTLLAKRSAGLL